MIEQGRRYRILSVLGKGGFGTVYHAELLGAGGFSKQVALKVLNANQGMPEEVGLRLRDEARVLGLLQHRAIVGIDSLAHIDKRWAVVMEYVEGIDLGVLLHHKVPVPVRAAIELVEEVASALHTAFEVPSRGTGQPLRLVHRDIKPPNIRLTASGEVKVLDFGVARAEFGGREATTEGLLFGSMRYMAPERIEGIDTASADLYALGMVLVEIAIGGRVPDPPKTGAERHHAWVDHVEGDLEARLESVRAAAPEQADQLVALLRRMLAFDIELRPTAKEVEEACRDIRHNIPGPYLRGWAEENVPDLMSVAHEARGSDPLTGSIVKERSGSLAIHEADAATSQLLMVGAEDQPESEGGLRTALVLAGLVGVPGVLAMLVVLLVGVAGLGVLLLNRPAGEPAPVDELRIGTVEPLQGTPEAEPDAEAEPEAEPEDPDPDEPADEDASEGEASRVEAAPTPAEEGTAEAPVVAAPEPEVEPEPAAAVPVGTVAISGDAAAVWLDGPTGRIGPGEVPAATYKVVATFGADEVPAGTVTVNEGQTVALSCSSIMMLCRKK